MDEYGSFSGIVASMRESMNRLFSDWFDEVATTYSCMNENIEKYLSAIWEDYADINECLEAVHSQYNEEEAEQDIARMRNMV